jgi:hypothetical protein
MKNSMYPFALPENVINYKSYRFPVNGLLEAAKYNEHSEAAIRRAGDMLIGLVAENCPAPYFNINRKGELVLSWVVARGEIAVRFKDNGCANLYVWDRTLNPTRMYESAVITKDIDIATLVAVLKN